MPTQLPLWPGTPPLWNPDDDRPQPTLGFYPHPSGGTRPCVVIFPGGGYHVHAPHENEPFRGFFHGLGYHAAVVLYRTQFTPKPRPLGKGPFQDAERAMHLLHEKAGSWQVDTGRIAVIGFSAGAHLAATLSVHAVGTARPSASILCYGVLLSGQHAHRGSVETLCGPGDPGKLEEFFNLPARVSKDTPPMFLWHTVEDAVVPVENSLEMSLALARHKIPHSLHVFPRGHHGLGLAEGIPMASAWSGLCAEWLRELWKA